LNWSARSITVVSEHFLGGSEVRAITGAADNKTSCTGCHQNSSIWEMLLPNESVGDYDVGNFDPYGTGGGGNLSASHYGRKRPDLYYLAGNVNQTDCAYCHQNTSTIFPFIDTYNMSIGNHSNRSTGPSCNATYCHNTGRIHDTNLTRPTVSASNDTSCYNCHYEQATSSKKNRHNGTAGVNCTQCHMNTSLGGKDIHPIKYVSTDNQFTASNTSAANCTTCHQNNMSTVTYLSQAPKVASPMYHSDNASAGNIWGSYWNDSGTNTSNFSCNYCHGKTMMHNRTLWSLFQGDNTVNASITITTGSWCSDCHYQESTNYNDMENAFTNAGLNIPPEIGNGTNSPNETIGYYNHSLNNNYTDAMCYECHGELADLASNMTGFIHNVKGGNETGGGPDCTKCHKLTGPENSKVNVSAMNLSVPYAYGVHGKINVTDVGNYEDDEPCWACHGNGSKPPDKKHNFDDDSTRYKNPRDCADCHVSGNYTAERVYEHNSNATGDVLTGAACEDCHNYSTVDANGTVFSTEDTQMGLMVNGDPIKANVSHYATNATLFNTTNCTGCHRDSSGAIRGKWGRANLISTSMGTKDSECYDCHMATYAAPTSRVKFHEDDAIEWNFNSCERPQCHGESPGRR
jgi:hypothetical protein